MRGNSNCANLGAAKFGYVPTGNYLVGATRRHCIRRGWAGAPAVASAPTVRWQWMRGFASRLGTMDRT